ncbi:retrotransposon protein, putative, ty3-gypsy subclass [Tanacetum coccineum]
MTLSPQAKDAEAVTNDESAPMPPTPYHFAFETKSVLYGCLFILPYSRSPSAKGGFTKFAEYTTFIVTNPTQRVANAIEAIAIYETKTNMARKSISQTEQQECKVADNVNNKRKWEGNHNGQCTIKGGNCKKVDHMTQECRNPTAARNQRTHTCCKCGSLRHFKSKCPIVKFQKRVNKKISTLSERQAENKRKLNNTSKDNQNQQQPNKRQNTGKAYAAGHREKKYYGGSKPLCPKCNYHHDGPCPPKCHRCNIVGHLVRNCRRPTNDHTANNQRGTGTSQKANCYECGNQGHYKRDCPERKNQSHKNQIGGTGAHGVVHTLRGEETDQDPNNTKDENKA